MTLSTTEEALRLLIQIICGEYKTGTEVPSKLYAAAIEIAMKNKIFLDFYKKSLNLHISIPPQTHALAKRIVLKKEAQREAIKELALVSEDLEIQFMVVKTFKPFDYIGDDVDILVSGKNDLELLTRVLHERHYFTRQVGTPEITMRKFILGTPVDLDIHHKLAAGYIQYVNTRDVWKTKVKRRIDGLELLTPTPAYEILITVGHSVLKEFRMTLADLLHYFVVSNNIPPHYLFELTSRNGLVGSLKIFICVVNHFLNHFQGKNVKEADAELISAISNRIFKSDYRMPYAYPIEALVYAHADKFKQQVRRRGFHAIPDYMKLPSSNGIALVFDYLEWILFKREPIPWK